MAKYIGQTNDDYVNGRDYSISTQSMTGKRFKPGKDSQGKWLDNVGERDTRIMLWKIVGPKQSPALKVYESEAAILKDFEMTY
jgi:hypothetical protein